MMIPYFASLLIGSKEPPAATQDFFGIESHPWPLQAFDPPQPLPSVLLPHSPLPLQAFKP
jgi:hypothetical protein